MTNEKNPAVKFRGVPFEYGDEILIVPALPLGQARELSERFLASTNGSVADETPQEAISKAEARIHIFLEAAELALKRNYPDTTREKVEDFLTAENQYKVWSAAISGQGTDKVKSLGEAQAVLEKKYSSNTVTSTGPSSTAE
jgi:hypothetical protein